MDNILFKTEEPISQREVLVYYHNMFTDSLIANCIDLKHFEYIKVIDPEYKKPDQRGVEMTVDMLIQSKKKGALFARQNLECIKKLLEKESDDTLGETWSDEALELPKSKISPIQKGDLQDNNKK